MNDDTRELKPGHEPYDETEDTTIYWIQDGKVLFQDHVIRGADAESFRYYAGTFAKDRNHCYCTSSRLTGANPKTFRMLNFTYATDGKSVWTMGGKIEGADAKTFTVCDIGVMTIIGTRVPYGFGKDKERVYYYNFDGKPNWVRKALPESFVSLNDGEYGKDARSVFWEIHALPKVNVERWEKLGCLYSRDDARVYYGNTLVPEADAGSFEIPDEEDDEDCCSYLGKDKKRHYLRGKVIPAAKYAKELGPVKPKGGKKK